MVGRKGNLVRHLHIIQAYSLALDSATLSQYCFLSSFRSRTRLPLRSSSASFLRRIILSCFALRSRISCLYSSLLRLRFSLTSLSSSWACSLICRTFSRCPSTCRCLSSARWLLLTWFSHRLSLLLEAASDLFRVLCSCPFSLCSMRDRFPSYLRVSSIRFWSSVRLRSWSEILGAAGSSIRRNRTI